MNNEPLIITGSCHCSGIEYRLVWPADGVPILARACGCSYCTRFKATWTCNPEASLGVKFSVRKQAVRYRFGSRTADFVFCRRCGVLCLAISRIDRQEYAVVNINTFTSKDEFMLDHSDSDFSAEATADRLDRRKQRWIGAVNWQIPG